VSHRGPPPIFVAKTNSGNQAGPKGGGGGGGRLPGDARLYVLPLKGPKRSDGPGVGLAVGPTLEKPRVVRRGRGAPLTAGCRRPDGGTPALERARHPRSRRQETAEGLRFLVEASDTLEGALTIHDTMERGVLGRLIFVPRQPIEAEGDRAPVTTNDGRAAHVSPFAHYDARPFEDGAASAYVGGGHAYEVRAWTGTWRKVVAEDELGRDPDCGRRSVPIRPANRLRGHRRNCWRVGIHLWSSPCAHRAGGASAS